MPRAFVNSLMSSVFPLPNSLPMPSLSSLGYTTSPRPTGYGENMRVSSFFLGDGRADANSRLHYVLLS